MISRKKKIYLIRHGQSTHNQTGIDLGANSTLTEKGKIQAIAVANKLKEEIFDIVITSTYKRAYETAEIISQSLNLELVSNDLFIENITPKSYLNSSPEIQKQGFNLIFDNFNDPNFRIEDAENFNDLNKRAQKAIEFLVNHQSEKIICVSHNTFIMVILAKIMLGKDLTSHICKQFIFTLVSNNTSISEVYFDERYSKLMIARYNDFSHLKSLYQ